VQNTEKRGTEERKKEERRDGEKQEKSDKRNSEGQVPVFTGEALRIDVCTPRGGAGSGVICWEIKPTP